ncbi:unnamed protein product [Hyaloperonospora brassicae]|uniref:Nucleoporin protein Ndc1-Nup n=1 Tax=Hyaloperonospora brassicae TaxID=162125 RepID=A0AAV0T7E8_HYABA|nr:unnamed protein product [Hyaloperonospora brassicae]
MGLAHTLELLHALLQLYATRFRGAPSCVSCPALPYPHLQQRLQQTLRAVALTSFSAVFLPLLLLCLAPVLSPLDCLSFLAFLLVVALLWTLNVAQLTLRYALVPHPRRAEATGPERRARRGLQAAVRALVDVVTRVQTQPQLSLLFVLCVGHSYLWQLVLYYGMASSALSDAAVGPFAVAGGLVSFVAYVVMDERLSDDPFVLDPRAAFGKMLQRDVVRAARRGVVTYVVGRVLSWLWCCSTDVAVETVEGGFLSLGASRVAFQITSSVLENGAILSAASVSRILLFRASYQVLGSAFDGANNLWESLVDAKPNEGDVAGALFATEVAVVPQTSVPLNEQYLRGLQKRKDAALQRILDKKAPVAPADAEDVNTLDSLFKFENLLTGCKFATAARASLFASRERWNALFSSTTAAVDGFTLMLHLLNSLQDRKSSADDTSALALERSFASLLRFLSSQQNAHPLILLHQYPHLANLRISSASVNSPVRFFVESKLQFAVRRFLIEEARRRVFQRVKVVRVAECLLCHLVSVSRAEDKQGYVQHTIPAVVSSLLECRKALDAYMETCLKESSTNDRYVQETTALAKGIDSGLYRITEVFQSELSMFAFPPDVKTALLAYASFDV